MASVCSLRPEVTGKRTGLSPAHQHVKDNGSDGWGQSSGASEAWVQPRTQKGNSEKEWQNWSYDGQHQPKGDGWGKESQASHRSSSAKKKKATWDGWNQPPWEKASESWESGKEWSKDQGSSWWSNRSTAPSSSSVSAGGKSDPSVWQGKTVEDGWMKPSPKWGSKSSYQWVQKSKKPATKTWSKASSSADAWDGAMASQRAWDNHDGAADGGAAGANDALFFNKAARRSAQRLQRTRDLKYSTAQQRLRQVIESVMGGAPEDPRECIAWARSLMDKTHVAVGTSSRRVAVTTGLGYTEKSDMDSFGTEMVDCSVDVNIKGECRLSREEFDRMGGTKEVMNHLIQGIATRLRKLTSEEVGTLKTVLGENLQIGESLMDQKLVQLQCPFPAPGDGDAGAGAADATMEDAEDNALGDSLASSVSVAQPCWKKGRFAADKAAQPSQTVINSMRKAMHELKSHPKLVCAVRARKDGVPHMTNGEIKRLCSVNSLGLELTWFGGPTFVTEDTSGLSWRNMEKPSGDPAHPTFMREGIEDSRSESTKSTGTRSTECRLAASTRSITS